MTKRVDQLDQANTISADDFIVIVNDPGGTPEAMVITYANFFGNVASMIFGSNTVPPANSNVTGQTTGKFYFANNYLYYSSNTSHTVRLGPFATF